MVLCVGRKILTLGNDFFKTFCIHAESSLCFFLFKGSKRGKIIRELGKQGKIIVHILLRTENIFGKENGKLGLNPQCRAKGLLKIIKIVQGNLSVKPPGEERFRVLFFLGQGGKAFQFFF